MHSNTLLILCSLLACVLGMVLAHVWHQRGLRRVKAWPRDFNLIARPMFNTEERLLYRELKSALPQHVVLAKVNLLRFCQSASDDDARLWFDRLHPINVSFAVCTPNGSVVSVIDLVAPQRAASERGQRLKEAVLEACRVRYLRCSPGHWPQPALLAEWALGRHISQDLPVNTGRRSMEPAASSPLTVARAELAQKLTQRRAERASRFHDSSFASDSFFAMDSRFDTAANSVPGQLDSSNEAPLPDIIVAAR
jgi:hypothetical protein